MAKKRIWNSILGLPIWLITGISIFILFSAIYDWIVNDRSMIRYGLIGGSMLILLILIILHFVPISFIRNQTKRQMGGQ